MQSTLSRTSSVASISSDDTTLIRRTRKRFTSVQLVLLEQLFHQTSHPTREERGAVAQAAGMEMKSVTIWFQNKRQTERKVALHHGSNQTIDEHRPSLIPNVSSSPSILSSPYASSTASASTSHPTRARTRTLSTTHAHTPRRKITPPRARPSLDHVATRSESRLPPPRTPTRPHDPCASLWDNMPSSPLAPPASPPAHDLVEFMGGSRTLEWACAAARLADKEARRRPRTCERDRDTAKDRDRDETEAGLAGAGYDTEEDDVEAVTPKGSLGASDGAKWRGQGVRARSRLMLAPAPDSVPEGQGQWVSYGDNVSKDRTGDEDMMRAALALCGLHRRSG